MDYMRTKTDGQLALTQTTEWLHFPSALHGFHNTPQQRKEQSPDVTSSASTVFSISRRKNVPVDVERGCISTVTLLLLCDICALADT